MHGLFLLFFFALIFFPFFTHDAFPPENGYSARQEPLAARYPTLNIQ